MIKKHISFVPGSWDIFHVGHIRLFDRIKKFSNKIIVGVNTDEAVLKHKGRLPIIPYEQRVEIMESMKFSDKAIKCEVAIDTKILLDLNVTAIVIGDDWKDRYLKGLDEAVGAGIEVIYLPYTTDISSTIIKEKIRE